MDVLESVRKLLLFLEGSGFGTWRFISARSHRLRVSWEGLSGRGLGVRAGDLGAGGGHREAAHEGAVELSPETWAVLPSAAAGQSPPGFPSPMK